MRPILVTVLAALMAAGALSPAAATPRAPMNPTVPRKPPSRFEAAIEEADKALQAKDWPGVYQALKPLLDSPELAAQTAERRHAILSLFASAALISGHGPEALAPIKLASAMPQAEGHDWVLRVFAAWAAEDGAEIGASMAELAERWPDEVLAFDRLQILGLHAQVSRMDRPADALALLDGALFKANWKSTSATFESDFLWVEYAGILLDRGDMATARTVAARIDKPKQLIQIRADRRFDPVVQRDAPAFDPRRAALARLERLTQLAKASPDSLDLVLAEIEEMRRLGRSDAARALVDEAIARIKARGDAAYSDLDDHGNWLYDLQARILKDDGKVEEALAIQAKGAGLREEGGDNTSQVLNLGSQLVALGRPKEALTAITKVGGMSGYGQMVRLYVDGCAQAQLNNQAKVQEDLAEMRKLWPVNAGALQELLICANDLDGAAQVLIERLADLRERTEILGDLQNFNDRPYTPPFTKAMGERLQVILKRPDVQAAIAKVGRIETYDLWPGDT